MTRVECEDKILDLLLEISKVYDEYNPGNNGVCTIIGRNGYVSVFALVHDADGEPILGKYMVNATQYADGDRRHWGS